MKPRLPVDVVRNAPPGLFKPKRQPEGVRVVGWQPLKSEDDGIGHAIGDDYNPFDA